MSIVTKGYGGKQLLLFGYGDILETGIITGYANCYQAGQECEAVAAFVEEEQIIILPGPGGLYISEKERQKKLAPIYARIIAEQHKQQLTATAQIVFKGAADCLQLRQKCAVKGNVIAISDEEIIIMMMDMAA